MNTKCQFLHLCSCSQFSQAVFQWRRLALAVMTFTAVKRFNKQFLPSWHTSLKSLKASALLMGGFVVISRAKQTSFPHTPLTAPAFPQGTGFLSFLHEVEECKAFSCSFPVVRNLGITEQWLESAFHRQHLHKGNFETTGRWYPWDSTPWYAHKP